jgi:hypothetical protein
MTHAEAAANRDFPLEKAKLVSEWKWPSSTPQVEDYVRKARELGMPHENYGPFSWFDSWPGGFAERWDLWQLKPSDTEGKGGFILRDKIKKYLSKMSVPEISVSSPAPPAGQSNECKIYVESQLVTTGYLLPDNRCYAQLSKLAAAYGVPVTFSKDHRSVNLLTTKFKPKYLADSPLISGYPVVDVYMNRPQDAEGKTISDPKYPVRPFMQGIIIKNLTYVLIADFCKELGIPFTYRNADRSIRLGAAPAS